MGDKADGLAGRIPEFQQLFVEMIADDFVERAEGFVHQQQVGIEGERAGDGGTLLHAAGKLPGVFLAETFEVDEVHRAVDAFALLGLGVTHDFERQSDVLFDAAPGIEGCGLKDITVGPVPTGVFRRRAVDGDIARRVLLEIGDDPQKSGLAATRRADE
ncbi:hypothetical protein SOVF_182090 [Spinacia oleracea]|nr:hypothetical protein SOVF_182090 [Spinacia oleracea]